MRIGILTTASGIVTSIPLTWVPESIFYVAATQLLGLTIESIDSGVITNLDGAGLTSFGLANHTDRVTNGYLIPIANGKIAGKNIDLTFTNSAAQTPIIYAPTTRSAGRNPLFVQSVQQQALADSGILLQDFSRAYFPNAAAADIFQITYRGGLTYKTTREELQAVLAIGNVIANGAADYMINNTLGNIVMVQFIPAATQTIYVQRLQSAGAAIILNQEV